MRVYNPHYKDIHTIMRRSRVRGGECVFIADIGTENSL